MKKFLLFLVLTPFILFANDKKTPSKIKEVTVYLSGAQIQRNANVNLASGVSEVILTGLSSKIDENSIQISGLQLVSILSMTYDINYLEKSEASPELLAWESEIENTQLKISLLRNQISGLEEEENVITKNRIIAGNNLALDIQRVKEISTYYRERITAIKNEIYKLNLEINLLNKSIRAIQNQMAEVNNAPSQPQGELKLKLDAPINMTLNLKISYFIPDAGWIPNYDIKSKALGEPLDLAYKANVYQNTGKDWDNVQVTLSTGNPNYNVAKPQLESKYLNFVSPFKKRSQVTTKKRGYSYNPTVRRVIGTVTDESGQPLPGVNVVVKGTSIGTQTDFDGNYALDVVNGRELDFSYIGQKALNQTIYSSVMNVRMEEDATALEEVVVSAYGMKREKKALGYAVNSVSSEEINEWGETDVARTLAGRAAGVQIRGASSILNYQPPLYIIDGVPSDDYDMGDFDESEIQHMEVLKGETASSIYGSKGRNGVVVITTKKSTLQDDLTNTKFIIKKPYSIASDNDITAIEINTFKLAAEYEYLAAPVLNENVFLTASFKNWEKYQLLPGEANVYYEGTYAGKTTLDPFTVQKEMVLSLGIDPNITLTRKQQRNFKSKSFTGSNRILNRVYDLEVKNNKNVAISLKLMDRIPKSQNKEIKVDDILTYNAQYDKKKGLLTWDVNLKPQETQKESFSFIVKYPRGRYISL
ncbi:mucoidy inhibitor MuiA family protein [Croceitalea sp. P059]|uniref:DUF4139 domain-containing protein n=1 Tax=Croceitalea sp. P059 TaxID=3075601 RepID=UPI002886F04C|nr:mucoidy inhibitor MuiA family protein [Croceitalea sp. P059]MDT0539799.1 mucoidy inhibitor MuiA family protein [Croceitalea sp. P059]